MVASQNKRRRGRESSRFCGWDFAFLIASARTYWPLPRGDASQTQLLRQTALPRAETAFSSSARLRGISRNHLNAEILHRPPHLSELTTIDLLLSFGCIEEMTGTIAI